jgi:hypothetical protein
MNKEWSWKRIIIIIIAVTQKIHIIKIRYFFSGMNHLVHKNDIESLKIYADLTKF